MKRLYEYARWFGDRGGASFIIHPNCASLIDAVPGNRYFIVNPPTYRRILNDWGYLDAIIAETGTPELYYAYGIPVYSRVGRVNWFHLSNVLPIYSRDIPLSVFDRIKMRYLGWRIQRNYRHADVISAESDFSLRQIRIADTGRLFLSVNGSDDELSDTFSDGGRLREKIAVVVGTYKYKALWDSYRVFETLRRHEDRLTLLIIGDKRQIPSGLLRKSGVRSTGLLSRSAVVEYLERAMYYISTTRVENSYNAASEGVFLAQESYISAIPPHEEMLHGVPFDLVSVPGVSHSVIHVRQADVSRENLKTWNQVVTEMMARAAS
ncbi:MAG: glycosyltransferase, GG-Bacteroidales peptide system [Gemmatimonadetes bacterium]|nr:glycosyltransferase, GG-Bacteroidales peptide system [Gemmatimonadota bacterium]